MSIEENRQFWNRLSNNYQSSTFISLEGIHYGPYTPSEKILNIVGEVIGLDCLELGGGGVQISIELKKWGARSVTSFEIEFLSIFGVIRF